MVWTGSIGAGDLLLGRAEGRGVSCGMDGGGGGRRLALQEGVLSFILERLTMVGTWPQQQGWGRSGGAEPIERLQQPRSSR